MNARTLRNLTKINALTAQDEDYCKMEGTGNSLKRISRHMWTRCRRRSATFFGDMPIWEF